MGGSEFDLLIRRGQIYSESGHEVADIGVKDGLIAAIGNLSNSASDTVVDAKGLAILPGAIDTQVHFREPGNTHKEDLESGSRAAVMGGVTTYFEMPNTSPTTVSRASLEDKLHRANGRSWSHYAFFVGATATNVDELTDLEQLPGAAGIKIFMGSSTGDLLVPDDETLQRILLRTKRRVSVHSEDHMRLEARKALLEEPNITAHIHPTWRDAECARLATERLIASAQRANARVHLLHVSTAEEPPMIQRAKQQGLNLTAEVTPQHLWFAGPEAYDKLGNLAQMNPPIRDDSHRHALRGALRAGVFDVFGSDHAPHTLEEKGLPYPNSPSGMPGVQTLLPAVLTLALRDKLLSVEDVVRMLCHNPARIFGIDSKGFIEVGADADLTLVDLKQKWTFERQHVASKCGWSPFEGETFYAMPIHVIVGGSWTVQDTVLTGTPAGQMVAFKPA